MVYETDSRYALDRYQRFIREAEQQDLVRAALAARPAQPTASDRALAWLGQHLIVWGEQLEGRLRAKIAQQSQHVVVGPR